MIDFSFDGLNQLNFKVPSQRPPLINRLFGLEYMARKTLDGTSRYGLVFPAAYFRSMTAAEY